MAGGIRGIGAGLKIDNASGTLTDVSAYMRSSSGSTDPQRLDDTTWQPDEANPIKTEIAGATTRNRTLTVLYTPAAFTFFTAIEGKVDLEYEFGPEGLDTGKQKISGLCNCLSVGEPSPGVDNVQEFTVEFNVTSRAVGTFA